MNEQELTEARALMTEFRAMLTEGTQAVRDIRTIAARFEGQAAPASGGTAAVWPAEFTERFTRLETEVQRTVQRLELRGTAATTALNALSAGKPS